MRTRSRSGWLRFALRVNGVELYEAFLRTCEGQPTDFEVVVRDRLLGIFALHEDFLLETRRSKQDRRSWAPISLAELKRAIWMEAQQFGANLEGPSSAERPERHPRILIERVPVEGDSSHLDRAEEALTRAGIRFQIVGGLDSRGRISGHVTLAVSSLLGAGMNLRQAGFLESPESKYVLVDSRTGWKMRLLEGRPTSFKLRLKRSKLPENIE